MAECFFGGLWGTEAESTHSNVVWVQAVLTPGRRYAAVQVGPRTTHVQLVLISLCGNVIPRISPCEQELQGNIWALSKLPMPIIQLKSEHQHLPLRRLQGALWAEHLMK